jgi:hypothetical protein
MQNQLVIRHLLDARLSTSTGFWYIRQKYENFCQLFYVNYYHYLAKK